MTITIHFHQSGFKTFKDYYTKNVVKYLKGFFPQLVSYNRLVELIKTAMIPFQNAYRYLFYRLNIAESMSYQKSTF